MNYGTPIEVGLAPLRLCNFPALETAQCPLRKGAPVVFRLEALAAENAPQPGHPGNYPGRPGAKNWQPDYWRLSGTASRPVVLHPAEGGPALEQRRPTFARRGN